MTEIPNPPPESSFKKRISWKLKTPEQIRAIIQEYANPANDASLTDWSARRLIGAMLRVEHDFEPYAGFDADYFYNPFMNDNLTRTGRYTVAPVRRFYRRINVREGNIFEAELKYMIVADPNLIIEGAQYWGSRHRFNYGVTMFNHAEHRFDFGVDKNRELLHQEVLLHGKLKYSGQKRPKWIKLEPNQDFDNCFSARSKRR